MKRSVFRPLLIAVASVSLLSMTSCSNMDHTGQNMLYGGAVGAGLGAATSAAYGGCVACGAAVGGTVGVASGYALDQAYYSR